METEIEFKDNLRKELLMYERYKKLLESDKKEELLEVFNDEIKRINASLQD